MVSLLSLYRFDKIKKSKCCVCKKKKPIVIAAIYDIDTDELDIGCYCKNCFRKEAPEYSLEGSCIVCKKNFKCNIQKLLFSKEEKKIIPFYL